MCATAVPKENLFALLLAENRFQSKSPWHTPCPKSSTPMCLQPVSENRINIRYHHRFVREEQISHPNYVFCLWFCYSKMSVPNWIVVNLLLLYAFGAGTWSMIEILNRFPDKLILILWTFVGPFILGPVFIPAFPCAKQGLAPNDKNAYFQRIMLLSALWWSFVASSFLFVAILVNGGKSNSSMGYLGFFSVVGNSFVLLTGLLFLGGFFWGFPSWGALQVS